MDKYEAAIFIDRSFMQSDRIARATDFFRKLLSLISVRVIVSLCTRCERKVFCLRNFAIEMLFNSNWTTTHDETGCKKLLDKYNADPLLLSGSE